MFYMLSPWEGATKRGHCCSQVVPGNIFAKAQGEDCPQAQEGGKWCPQGGVEDFSWWEEFPEEGGEGRYCSLCRMGSWGGTTRTRGPPHPAHCAVVSGIVFPRASWSPMGEVEAWKELEGG